MRPRKGFTLIELLVVIAIIAVLAVVVVLTLNPAGLLQESRDSNRLSDMATLNSAIGLSLADDSSEFLGSSSVLYVSVPDPVATSSLGDQCQGLGLPSLPAGWAYQCVASGTFRKVDGTGWMPVSLGRSSFGSSLAQLPLDPVNSTSTGLYYTYVTDGRQFEVTSLFESQKYKAQFAQNPIVPGYPEVDAKGSSLSLSPLWNPSGLVGYWPMDEGTGILVNDASGNGNAGVWSGSLINGSHYAGGKVGSSAGTFNGSDDSVSTASSSLPLGNNPRSAFAWINWTGSFASSFPTIVSYGDQNIGGESSAMRIDPTGSLDAVGAGSPYSFATTFLPTPNTWHFVGYTYSGGTSITVYYDGQSQTGSITQRNTILPSSNPSLIGTSNGGSWFFPGSIDDVRIYNRAVSAAEVQALYNAEK